MNFEAMESVEMESSATEEIPGSSPQIAKRKRTKRRRNALSSSSSGGDVCGDGKRCIPLQMGSEEDRNYESTVTTEEEDEDMANCLMMLARSGSRGCDGGGEDYEKTDRKRKAETSVGGVYECKTCDKAFQSFQALGGHRASHHKKAKHEVDIDVKPTASSIERNQLMMLNNTAAYSTTANINPPSSSGAAHSTKVHQCAICGTAFSSGQALGGHMRRHRAAIVSSVDNNHSSTVTVALSTPVLAGRVSENNNFLSSLDLNLPAPPEEDHDAAAAAADENHHTRFNQQFPPMVGCYF